LWLLIDELVWFRKSTGVVLNGGEFNCLPKLEFVLYASSVNTSAYLNHLCTVVITCEEFTCWIWLFGCGWWWCCYGWFVFESILLLIGQSTTTRINITVKNTEMPNTIAPTIITNEWSFIKPKKYE